MAAIVNGTVTSSPTTQHSSPSTTPAFSIRELCPPCHKMGFDTPPVTVVTVATVRQSYN